MENLDKFINDSLQNTPNSSSFIDSDRIIGRKGTLTIIDTNTDDHKVVWAISNSRVLCFYQSNSYLSIAKFFRNSYISIKDLTTTPCFMIINNINEEDNLMVCASSVPEKEIWVMTIKNNIGK